MKTKSEGIKREAKYAFELSEGPEMRKQFESEGLCDCNKL